MLPFHAYRILLFLPTVMFGEAAWDESQRCCLLTVLFFLGGGGIFLWGNLQGLFEQQGEGGQTFKPDCKTGFRYTISFFQQPLGFFQSEGGQVLMGRFAKCLFEQPEEMVFGKGGLVGDVFQVNLLSKVKVYIQFGIHYPLVHVQLGMWLRLVRIWFCFGIHTSNRTCSPSIY